MRDEITRQRLSNNECMIINIDHSSNQGTHWTCLFIDSGKCYYFDSYGFEPPLEVKQYCNEPRHYSTFVIQKMNQVICGHYCIYVLHRLNNGADFYEICFSLLK